MNFQIAPTSEHVVDFGIHLASSECSGRKGRRRTRTRTRRRRRRRTTRRRTRTRIAVKPQVRRQPP